jgi:predicted DNA-binding protein (MmcQ/YjbR family)
MNLSRFRDLCTSLAGVTEQVQWGDDLVFKVGGRMFSVACTGPVAEFMGSFKCDPETFAELCEREGLAPAPYLARAHWVAFADWDALTDAEYRDLVPRVRARQGQAVARGADGSRCNSRRTEAGSPIRRETAGRKETVT